MSIVYIAGQISGDKGYKNKFQRAERYLRGCGCDVILNPAEMLPENMENKHALPICMRMIEQADVIFFLPDWSRSPGASIERLYSLYLEKRVEYLPEEGGKAK